MRMNVHKPSLSIEGVYEIDAARSQIFLFSKIELDENSYQS